MHRMPTSPCKLCRLAVDSGVGMHALCRTIYYELVAPHYAEKVELFSVQVSGPIPKAAHVLSKVLRATLFETLLGYDDYFKRVAPARRARGKGSSRPEHSHQPP